MNIYRLGVYIDDDFSYLDFETSLDLDLKIDLIDGKRISVSELKNNLKLKNKTKQLPDLLGTSSGGLFVSEKVKEILSKNVDEVEINFIPIIIENNQFYILNIIGLLDCFDYDNSQYTSFEDGFPDEISKVKFVNEKVPQFSIFRIEEYATTLFITEKLKNIFEEAGVTGVKYSDNMDLTMGN